MKKEILINVLQPEETRIAILENGILEELYVERVSHESYVGNIYKGKIVNIEPSIQAAFIDFGVGRNGFLHISDVDPFYFNGGNGIEALIEASQGAVSAPRSRRAEFDDEDDDDIDDGPEARQAEAEPERERERRPRRGERSDSRRRPEGRDDRGRRSDDREERGRRDEVREPESRDSDEHHDDERGPTDAETIVDRGEGEGGETSSRGRGDRDDRGGERGGRRRGRRGRGRRKREAAVDTDIPSELTAGGRELPDLEDFDIEATPELPPADEPEAFRASEEPPASRREIVLEEPTFSEPSAKEPAPEPAAPVEEEEDSFGLGILEDESNGSGSGGAGDHEEDRPVRRQPGVHRRTSPADDDDDGGFGSGIFGDEPEKVSRLEPSRSEAEEPRGRAYDEDRQVDESRDEGPQPRVERFDRDDERGPVDREPAEAASGGEDVGSRDRGGRSSEEGEDGRPRRRRRRGGRGRRGRSRDNEETNVEAGSESPGEEEESLSFENDDEEMAPPAARDERQESRPRRGGRRDDRREMNERREAEFDDRHDSDFGDGNEDEDDNFGNRIEEAPAGEPRRSGGERGDRDRGGRGRGGRDRGERSERGSRDRGRERDRDRDDRDSESSERRSGPRGDRRGGRNGGRSGGMRGSNARRPRQRPPIQEIFRRGQEVLVQVIKEGIGNKGPTLSTYISIPGRYLVLMPGLNRVGVSRKIVDEDQRRKLRDLVAQLDRPNGVGFIIRTAGLERSQTDLERDMSYLLRLWDVVLRRIKNLKGPNVIYQESDMIIRTIRDIFSSDIDTIYIDEPNAYERAKEFLQLIMPKYVDRLKLYDKPEPLFHNFGIEQEISRIQERTVPLARGGSIVVDQTEALVAIDVNSGNFRADDNAEETAYQMNLAAAKEIARQLRLRDLGGVIVNDFIDMKEERHRRDVENALRDAVRRDRARTKILRMSAFGLIEMTRQRIRPSLKRSLYRECSVCHGTGQTKTVESMSIDCMRMLTHVGQRKEVRRIQLSVHTEIAEYLLNHKRPELIAIEQRGEISLKILGQPMKSAEDFELLCYDEDGDLLQIGPPPNHHGGGRR